MGMISKQIEELRKYARKWSEWNGFDAAMPVLPSTNIRLLCSAADTIEALDRPTGKWIHGSYIGGPDYRRCNQCFAEIEEIFFGFEYDVNYCPNCGARMYKGGENE